MKKTNKKLLVVAALLATITGFSLTSFATIKNSQNSPPTPTKPTSDRFTNQVARSPSQKAQAAKPMKRVCTQRLFIVKANPFAHHWRHALRVPQNYSKHDAQIITQAALLLYGHKNLQVGSITNFTTPRGHKLYLLSIVNQHNQIVKKIMFNPANAHVHALPLQA